MYPNRNSHDGIRRGAGGFQPTFINSGGLPHRIGSLRQTAVPSARSNSTRTVQPTTTGGRTTVVRPGQPHYFDTRSDFQTGRLINTLCRCRDPNSHGNAWTIELPGHYDRSGREITYQQLLNCILDHYGTATVSNEQQTAAYWKVCDSRTAADLTEEMNDVERDIRMGIPAQINPHEDVTYFNGDGHAQRFAGEHGLQTVMPERRGGAGRGRGGNESARSNLGSRR
jgi:hypothetical protein